MLITTESMVFAGLISANFFVRAASKHWPQGGIAAPDLGVIVLFSVILLGQQPPGVVGRARHPARRRAPAPHRARRGLRHGRRVPRLHRSTTSSNAEFGWTANAYASLFFTIIGLHALHVAAGLAMSAGVQAKAATGRIDGERHMTVRMFAMYWHFVDAVWIVVFTSLYLTVIR